jgi:ABC-type transport system involved in multi-copper enzyme maturation permease subunit
MSASALCHLYATSGIDTCHANGDCGTVTTSFLSQVSTDVNVLRFLGDFLHIIPAIIGIFWGAPLITRELEAGTHRLAWNQSVTRTRWLAVKLALIGVAGMAAAGLASLMITWRSSPLDTANMR